MNPLITARLDHIVVAARTLAEGREWCAETLGVDAVGGGKHEGLATHNTLLRLGEASERHYLEIIAIDPDAGAAIMPRWFGLDSDEVQSLVVHGPRLVAWVARCSGATDAIERITQTPGYAANIVRPAARADFRWRFSFTVDGARIGGGALPHLIQWDVDAHPCDRLPDCGVTLRSLTLGTPVPEQTSSVLEAFGFADDLVHLGQSTSNQLVATLQTPLGTVILD